MNEKRKANSPSPTRQPRIAPRLREWLVVGLLAFGAGLGIPAHGDNATGASKGNTANPPPPEQPAAKKEDAHAQGRGPAKPGEPLPARPLWEDYVRRLREVTADQVQLKTQQEMLRRRIDQSGPMADRVRERIASRLHELDAQEREIRQKKQALLAEIAANGKELQTQLEDAQADLMTRQAAETTQEKRKEMEGKLREVEELLKHLSEIQENPGRDLDLLPPGWALPGPPMGPGAPEGREGSPPARAGIPPGIAARRIQQMEEQIHFLRRRLDGMERELEEMKHMLGLSGIPPMPGTEEDLGQEGIDEGNRLPGPPIGEPGLDRRRRPDRPPMTGPRRGAIPPAGFAPGAEPGLGPIRGTPLQEQLEKAPGAPPPPPGGFRYAPPE